MKWETIKLSSCCQSISDGDHLPPPKVNSGIPFVTISDITSLNQLSFQNTMFVPQKYYDSLDEKRKPHRDDILYSVVGSFGVPIFVKDEYPFVFQRHIAILRPNISKIVPRFLYYAMLNPNFYSKADTVAIGTAQRTISLSALRNLKIEIPNLKTQNKIASILSAYDDLIENNQKRIKLLEQMAQRLYQEWFVRFRFPGYETTKFVDGIPQGWEYGRLSEVISLLDSKRIPLSSMERDRMERNYPYYGAAGQLGFVEDFIFDGTYLLLGEDGSVITEDGYPYLQYVWGKFWVNNHAHIIEQRGNYSVEFLYCMFKKMNVQSIVTGVAQPKISQGRLFMKKVLLPSDIVLKAFNEKIQPLFSQIKVLTEQNKKLTKQRDLLLPRLMSGKLAV